MAEAGGVRLVGVGFGIVNDMLQSMYFFIPLRRYRRGNLAIVYLLVVGLGPCFRP